MASTWKYRSKGTSRFLSVVCSFFFFFSSRRRHTRWNCDWSSDVCSSDLRLPHDAFMTQRFSFYSLSIYTLLIALVFLYPTILANDSTATVAAGGIEYKKSRSEERRVGKECRSRWSPDN